MAATDFDDEEYGCMGGSGCSECGYPDDADIDGRGDDDGR